MYTFISSYLLSAAADKPYACANKYRRKNKPPKIRGQDKRQKYHNTCNYCPAAPVIFVPLTHKALPPPMYSLHHTQGESFLDFIFSVLDEAA